MASGYVAQRKRSPNIRRKGRFMFRAFVLALSLGLCMCVAGCGSSQREQTLSTLNVTADAWPGGPNFKTDAVDAYGRPLVATVTKGVLNFELELRSHGPDGLPKNTDDIVVRRHKRHGESTVNAEIERGSESVGRGGMRGAIQGAKEAFAGKGAAGGK